MNSHVLEVFYDGACPLCRKEIALLKKRNRDGTVRFTDVAGPTFSAREAGKTYQELMASLHGKRSDGRWLEGVDLFAELYDLCRIPFLAALMRNRLLRPFLRLSYRFFARYRLTLTRRKACTEACDMGKAAS